MILKVVDIKDTSKKGNDSEDTIGMQTFTHSVICEPLIICGNALARMVIPTKNASTVPFYYFLCQYDRTDVKNNI